MKKLIAVLFCAGKILFATATNIPIEFEKDSEKFTSETKDNLFRSAEELYLAKGIKVTLQEPSKNADIKKLTLFYKREKELKEFFKEEHLDFSRISFTYEAEGKKSLPVINIEIVNNEVIAEVIHPDSVFTNKNSLLITCQPEDTELANTLSYKSLTSQDDMYNTNVSSYFENKIILIRELIKIEFQNGRVPNKPVIAQLPISASEKKSYLLLHWNNINREWSKTGTTVRITSKKDKKYFSAKIEESGIYALVESKSVSVKPIVITAPKNAAITYIELISSEPFVRIEGTISDNQKEATFKGPKNHKDCVIRTVCQDATGKEWIEETPVKNKNILSIFNNKKKTNAYFKQ
jgi:hypothetical protein